MGVLTERVQSDSVSIFATKEGTPDFLDQAVGYARRITRAKLLLAHHDG
jgi:hypothetical protein